MVEAIQMWFYEPLKLLCRNMSSFMSWVVMRLQPLTTNLGCLCMFMWPNFGRASPFIEFARVIDGATLDNLAAMIVLSLVEYGGLNEQDVVNKLVFFWSWWSYSFPRCEKWYMSPPNLCKNMPHLWMGYST